MKNEKEPILARVQSMFVGKVSRNRENPFKKKKYVTAELYFLITVHSHFFQKLLKNDVSFSVYHIK